WRPPRTGPCGIQLSAREGEGRAESSCRRGREGEEGGRLAGPEVGDRDAELGEQRAQERQADADDAVVVALDAGDEGAAEPVDSKGAGDDERLARRDVGVDLRVAEVGEVDGGRRDGARLRRGGLAG